MHADEAIGATDLELHKGPQQIASWGWLLGFLLIGAGVVTMGSLAQQVPDGTGGATGSQFAIHGTAIPVYLSLIVMDWILLYYCWAGVHRYGGGLATLSGDRWTTWKSVAIDMGIALPFWFIWEGTAHGIHWLLSATTGTGGARTIDSLLPRSVPEILLWVVASATAGICEELAFRGFLLKQFHALTGNIAVAVLAQGLVFGLFHFYQGWRNVVVIGVLGALFGVLAAWRRNLRANVVVHAWADIWGGWLNFVVWK